MRHPRKLASLPLVLVAILAVAPLAAQEAGEAERERKRAEHAATREGHPTHGDAAAVGRAVRETVAAFKRALRSGDSTGALALLHPEVRIYESGHAETKADYRGGHLEADMRFLQAVSSETTRDAVVNGGTMALYTSEYRATGTFRGREVDGRGTETMVLVPTAEGWRIRHIHWSSR